jgi:hypothetical protein
MPVMVPAKPVIAAKTSLFHVRSNAKCAISSAVKLNVKAMANLTPSTKRSLGGISSAVTVLSVVLRVKARFIQSVMVPHPLLPQTTIRSQLPVLHLLVHQETVQQILRLASCHMRFGYDGGAGGPRHGHRDVVDVVQAIAVAEAVLRQNDVPALLTEHADVDAPAFDGHVYAADAVAQALADAGVVPLQHD